MHPIEPRKLLMALLAICVGVLLAVPALATESEISEATDGEPTDPECILNLAENNLDQLEHAGFEFEGETSAEATEYEAWLDALIDLLKSLGLLEEETAP